MYNRPNTQLDPELSAVAARIDGILRGFGVDPALARVDDGSGRSFVWQFQRGTALVEVLLLNDGGKQFFQVCSPILHLPHDGLTRLYRRLLEYNMQLSGAAFAIYRDVVYVVHERALAGLDDSEAHEMISTVAAFADQLDDRLVAEFGGRLFGQV